MQKFGKPSIKTSEFAKLCNTSKRTLQYYDVIDLFKPAYVNESGYRFYSESQCDLFFTIVCLAEIGMSLEKIRDYIQNKNPVDLKSILHTQLGKVAEEMCRLEQIRQIIETKINLVEQGLKIVKEDFRNRVYLEYEEEEYMIISPELNTSDHDILINGLCKHIAYCSENGLNAGNPYAAIISFESLMANKFDNYAFFATKVYKKPIQHTYHVKPRGLYATLYLKGDYYDSEEAYHILLKYIDTNNYIPGKFSYKEAILDEVSEAQIDNYLTKISIPIYEREEPF